MAGKRLLLFLAACLVGLAAQVLAQGPATPGPAPAFVLDAQNPDPSFGLGLDTASDENPFGEAEAPAPKFGLVPAGEAAKPRLKYQGNGVTGYGEAPIPSTGAVGFSCGFGFVGAAFQGAYVGVGSAFYLNGAACGRCVKVQCDDASCAEPGKSITALIVDLCGDCEKSDLAIATPLFANLTGRDLGPQPDFQLSWDVVDCGPLIEGNIKMLVKPGGNAYFESLNFANVNGVIKAVQISSAAAPRVLLKRGSDNSWTYNPADGPFQLSLLGTSNEVLRVQLPALKTADIGVQFKGAPPANGTAAAAPPAASPPAAAPQAARSGR